MTIAKINLHCILKSKNLELHMPLAGHLRFTRLNVCFKRLSQTGQLTQNSLPKISLRNMEDSNIWTMD